MTHASTPEHPQAPPRIDFAPDLPVCAHRAAIEQALRAHQVVIVCGETGSGKTTQLPKMALALALEAEKGAANGKRPPLIGHTQPRRIAAVSVARRIAEELHTPLGEVVGYKVRFADRLAPAARIKLMTDGILLAETQTDALLRAYGTLIIDEAHERSLNIDFLLGHLRRILPRRPDLKVIVTSATIDAQRFAEHFTDAKGCPAPVLQVSGRTYPVEVRWRPFEESRDFGLNEAIAGALDELWPAAPAGDVLVFLPGEREIRDAADHLRAHLARRAATRAVEVLPLYARLSAAEQERVFAPHSAARVVLATNVAETSLTVPGIRYVIDSGTARVKRYSLRSKVEQLLIEPVSQAAAGQRAGRCGRLGPGVCIRLYEEKEFAQRPRFTDPEILRSSLAAVILRLKSLRLGEGRVQDFPFLDAPSGRAIADGFQLLAELGAVDEAQNLTALGRELARLPLDPRVGRMLLEARARGALPEVLVIAAALSVQDVRERPVQAQAQADQAHARFADERSEFSGLLRLWQWLDEVRGGRAAASAAAAAKAAREAKAAPRQPSRAAMAALPAVKRAELALAQAQRVLQEQGAEGKPTHRLSRRQWEAALRAAFISVRRVREWRDIHAQLAAAMHGGGQGKEQGGGFSASYEAVHKSLLAGLLGNVGWRMEQGSERGEYLGARGIKFFRHPGAHLKRRNGGSAQWIICAELVETTRLFGRGIAAIEPQWLEEIGAHLIKKQVLDPHWEKKAQDVVALERGTLYGLTVYSGRRKSYGKYDAHDAREILIRQALVAGLSEDALPEEWLRSMPFLRANARTIASVQELEHKSRRQDLLVDEELIYAFYDAHIPQHIASGRDFEAWWRQAQRQNRKLLHLSREELMRHEAAGITTAAYPNVLRLGGVDCAASYLHQPGEARDGLTVSVPLFALNQIDAARCEWLAPGMLREKLQALLKSLPQKPRSRFQPLAESAARLAQDYAAPERFGKGSLVDALLDTVRAETGLRVARSEMRLENLPPHLFMNFRILGEHGRQIGEGRDLAALKAAHGGAARGAFQALAALKTARAALEKPAEKAAEKPAEKRAEKAAAKPAGAALDEVADGDALHTRWDFGQLPELMEIRRKGHTLMGFPALVDAGAGVHIEVFDEPDVAAARHRAGLRRLFALQVREQLKYLEKNIPELQRMAVAYMPLGTEAQLRESILALAIERAFLAEPLPTNEDEFEQRVQDGKARLGLIAGEIARLAAAILQEYTLAARRVKDARAAAPEASRDAEEQMQRLLPARFLLSAPWEALQHFPRYLKAITMRFEKRRADPERDARHMAEARAQERRFWRTVSARQGQQGERLQALRWMLEELRVSLFAQELRTRQPVSVKRLDKAWAQIQQ